RKRTRERERPPRSRCIVSDFRWLARRAGGRFEALGQTLYIVVTEIGQEAVQFVPDRGLLAPRHRPAPQSSRIILPLWPVHADGVAPVPVQRGRAHLVKDAHADGRRLRHLNDRAGVPFIEKIDERAARGVTLLADLPAGSQRAIADLMVVHWPARPM